MSDLPWTSEAKFIFSYGVGCNKRKLHLMGVRCRKNRDADF